MMAVRDALLTATEPHVGGGIGGSVAVSRDFAAVGVPWRSTWFGREAGTVHVYRRSGTDWLPDTELRGWELDDYDRFGRAMALSGDMLVIGAPGFRNRGALFCYFYEGEWRARYRVDAPPGAHWFGGQLAAGGDVVLVNSDVLRGPVHVYRRVGTQLVAEGKLVGDNPYSNDDFGESFDYTADTGFAVVGAPRAGDSEPGAYVFQRSGAGSWHTRAKLPRPATPDTWFGGSVAISGLTVLIGEPAGGPVWLMGLAHLYEADNAGVWRHRQTVRASDPAIEDFFGATVALSGDTALISAPRDDTTSGIDSGSVYVFRRTGTSWTEQGKLIKTPAGANEFFGRAIALDHDVAAVTANDEPFGAAVVFRRSASWAQEASLQPREPSAHDQFGFAVAAHGDVAAVGAPTDDPGGTTENSGAAYVFHRSADRWEQAVRLTAPSPASGEQFGSAIAAGDGYLVVGAPPDINSGPDTPGTAHVFRWDGDSWVPEAVLAPHDGRPDQIFGGSVAAAGDTVVVGSRLADSDAAAKSGAAYVFVRQADQWRQQAKLVGNDAQSGDNAGASVAISGDTIVVGARGHDTDAGRDAGAAYVFARSGSAWTQEAKLLAGEPAASDRFGFSVATADGVIVVGAPGRQYVPTGPGFATVFRRTGASWARETTLRPEQTSGSRVGSAVAAAPGTVLIGASTRRSVHVYARSGSEWSPVDRLAGEWNEGGFGGSIAASGRRVVVGAPSASTQLGPSGAAAVYTLG